VKSRTRILLGLAVVAAAGVGIGWWMGALLEKSAEAPANPSWSDSSRSNEIASRVAISTIHSPAPGRTPLPGETILRDYGRTNLPPENDLTLLSHLMENFSLLVKGAADRPLSANEDWAAALRGSNPAHERFLPDHHAAFNDRGQLIDRWGTPLFFHALGGRRFELRSAGPDRTLWTDDDLHRNADGSFRRGAELNPPSLFSKP